MTGRRAVVTGASPRIAAGPVGKPTRELVDRLASVGARLAASDRDGGTVLFFSTVVIYLLTANYTQQSVDTVSMSIPAWQIAHHGNIFMDGFARQPLWWVKGPHGLVSNRFPGAAFLAVPFYLLDRTGYPTAGPSILAAAGTAAGATVLLWILLRRLTTPRRALGAALIFAFASPTWTVSAGALWTHGPGQFWLLLGLLAFVHGRPLAAGLSFGAAILTRPHYGVVPVVLGVAALASTRRLRPTIWLAAGSGLGLGLLAVYNDYAFGSDAPLAGYAHAPLHSVHGSLPSLLERIGGSLLSPSRGVLVLTPFLLLLLPGLRAAWPVAPTWVRAAAVGGSLYMLVQLAGNPWNGGYAFFSFRYAIEWLTLCAPLLVLCHDTWTTRRAWRRRAFEILVVYAFATHALGALLFVAEKSEPDYWHTWHVGLIVRAQPLASALVLALATAAGVGMTRLLRTGVLPTLHPAADRQLDLDRGPSRDEGGRPSTRVPS